MASSQTRAIANNDIAYLWWRLDAKIPGCLGFSVRRIAGGAAPVPLPAFVGFAPGVPGQPHPMKNTDVWPVQSFQWKDVFAPPGRYRYEIVPMMGPDAARPGDCRRRPAVHVRSWGPSSTGHRPRSPFSRACPER